MKESASVVVTTIASPNESLNSLAKGCMESGYNFIVVGDISSPSEFNIDGCDYYSYEEQLKLEMKYPKLCPQRHYARKNIGYLLAIREKMNIIIDTDDDNNPYSSFWNERQRSHDSKVVDKSGWVNIYRYFSKTNIWPRGFPLGEIHSKVPKYESLNMRSLDCPIQQGLADDDPDVDAIYRLTTPVGNPFNNKEKQIALSAGAWCPFNSQNTAWWKDAFPLLYLPAYCSFRMTDIWRSFVAQRIAWANNWNILFHGATVSQERNEHDLMKDFLDEIPGYLNNEKICEELYKLDIKSGMNNIHTNLMLCYEMMIQLGLIDKIELELLDAWLDDLNSFN
jgi:hypothetical protein